MKKVTLTIKDDRKINFLMELLAQFDFIEIQESRQKENRNYDFFASAGLWKNRKVTAEQLRKRAWQRDR